MEVKSLFRKNKGIPVNDIPVSFGSNGIRLLGNILIPEKATESEPVPGAVICHGFGSDRRTIRKSAEMLAQQGVATMIFDFRGHGASDGAVDDRLVDDAVDAWNTLKKVPCVDGSRMGIIGHSLGALSAVMAAGRVENPGVLVALNCPPKVDRKTIESKLPASFGHWGQKDNLIVNFPRQGNIPWINGIGSVMTRLYMFACGYHVRINVQRFAMGIIKMDMAGVVSRLEKCAKLFVFCKGDTITPYLQAMPVYESACYPREKIVSRGHHAAPITNRGLRSQWINWTAERLNGR